MPQLTPHFSWSELRYDATPVQFRGNVEALARLLESARAVAGGGRLRVTSAYRSPLRNTLAGGVSHSQHLTGSAADFVPLDLDAATVFDRLRNGLDPTTFGQLIYYRATSHHLHLSLPNRTNGQRGQVLEEVAPKRYRTVGGGPVADDGNSEGVASVLGMLLGLGLALFLLKVLL